MFCGLCQCELGDRHGFEVQGGTELLKCLGKKKEN